MAEENEYLVRGALLYCTNGTHPRRINLPICHGSYIKGHPLLHKLFEFQESLSIPLYLFLLLIFLLS